MTSMEYLWVIGVLYRLFMMTETQQQASFDVGKLGVYCCMKKKALSVFLHEETQQEPHLDTSQLGLNDMK